MVNKIITGCFLSFFSFFIAASELKRRADDATNGHKKPKVHPLIHSFSQRSKEIERLKENIKKVEDECKALEDEVLKLESDNGRKAHPIRKICYNPIKNEILALYGNKRIYIWDLQTGAKREVFSESAQKNITDIYLNGESEYIFAFDKKIRGLHEGSEPWAIKQVESRLVSSFCAVPDSSMLLTVNYGGKVFLWDTHSRQLIKEVFSHVGSICCLCVTRNHSVVAGTELSTLKIKKIDEESRSHTIGLDYQPRSIVLHPLMDDTVIVAGDKVEFVDLKTGEKKILSKKKTSVIAVNHNNVSILAAGLPDGTIKIWNLIDEKIHIKLKGHASAINGLAFLKNGHLVSSSEDGMLIVWSIKDKTLAIENLFIP